MAGSVDVYADVLDDQGTWQRVFIRLREDGGYRSGLRDLDYIGKIEPLHGSVVGASPRSCCSDCKNESVPQWLTSLKARLKGTPSA